MRFTYYPMVNIEILTQKGEKVKVPGVVGRILRASSDAFSGVIGRILRASSDALSGVIGRSLRLWRGSSDSDAS